MYECMADEQNQNQQLELEKLRAQAEEYLNGWKRAKADLVNYQKAQEREKAEWFMFANAGCVKAMLPVLDSLEAAIVQRSHFEPTHQNGVRCGVALHEESRDSREVRDPSASPGATTSVVADRASLQDDKVVAGLQKIFDQMWGTLQQMGVEAIQSVGEPVNTELHEVVATEKDGSHASGIIIKEAQRGYTMHGKTLRPAKVIVAE